ncbi:helix-turn-helix domain-containing protein [Paenibacillus piri]|nr:helix-turn-helix domain-containing protein [Paenibacillus piri]
MKLMIADDQPSTHRFLDKMIDWTSLGISEVHHAFHGQEAVERIRELEPELLILDLRMPILDGIGVLRQLEPLPRKPKTIILSAHDEFEYARDAMKFGVRHYLLKPIDTAAVIESVGALGGEVRREAADRLESAIAGVCRLKAVDEAALQAINGGFRASGIGAYVCLFVTAADREGDGVGDAAGMPLPAMPNQFVVRLNRTDAYIIQGIPGTDDPGDTLRACRSMARDGLIIGISRVQRQAELLLTGLQQCEAAAEAGFYDGIGAYEYAETPLTGAIGGQERDELARGLTGKLELDYSAPALERAVDAMFAGFRRKRVAPAAVYAICHHILFMMLKDQHANAGGKPPCDKLEPQPTLHGLQSHFVRHLQEIVRGRVQPAFSAEATIHRIKQYVDTSFSGDLSLDTMAAKFILNKYQLCRLFKREFGVSYWSYVTRVRMEKASELLLYTPHKVAHIALTVGYPDESHFSNVFKKYYGLSPTDYKRSHAQQSSTTNQ